jgi:hypothetical protein
VTPQLDARMFLLVIGLALAAAGCPSKSQKEMTTSPSRTLTQALNAHAPDLMNIPGVVGTAESRLDDGRPCILVLVTRLTPELRAKLPEQIEGWPVKVEASGEIHAFPDSTR